MKRKMCPRCGKSFGSAQGLSTHMGYSKSCGSKNQERPELAPANLTSTPSAEKSISTTNRQKAVWDINWSQTQKEAAILNSLGLTWGIARRGGRWVPVPVVGGIGYDEAVIAADRWNAISRIKPVLTVRRPSRPAQEPTEDNLLATLLILSL